MRIYASSQSLWVFAAIYKEKRPPPNHLQPLPFRKTVTQARGSRDLSENRTQQNVSLFCWKNTQGKARYFLIKYTLLLSVSLDPIVCRPLSL